MQLLPFPQPQSLTPSDTSTCYAQKQVCSHPSAPNFHRQRATWGRCPDPATAACVLREDITLWGPQSHLTCLCHPEPSGGQASPGENGLLPSADTQTPKQVPLVHQDSKHTSSKWPHLFCCLPPLMPETPFAIKIRPTETDGCANLKPQIPREPELGWVLCRDMGNRLWEREREREGRGINSCWI